MQLAVISLDGQVTIPAEIMQELGIEKGDKVCFLKKDGEWIIKPSFQDSLKAIQNIMKTEKSDLHTEDDVIEWMKEVRKEFVEESYNLK